MNDKQVRELNEAVVDFVNEYPATPRGDAAYWRHMAERLAIAGDKMELALNEMRHAGCKQDWNSQYPSEMKAARVAAACWREMREPPKGESK